MSPRVAGWFRFALLYLAIGLVLAGVILFVGGATHVYHYDYQHSTTTQPDGGATIGYDQLTPAQQTMVDEAISGQQLQFAFDSPGPIPSAQVVEKDGTYYVFSFYTTFDWLDYHTSGPALLGLLGLVVAYLAIRWENRYNPFA